MEDNVKTSLSNQRSIIQRLMFFVLFAFCTISTFAQGKVTGTVVDATGEPVIGASVLVKGTSNGTVTDLNGNFTISNAQKNSTIVVSYVGYKSEIVALSGRQDVKITLQEDKKVLDEIVVVGYGTMKKSDVTGAMARVGEKELNAMPVKDALQAMQGKTAGVDITSSQRPGETGGINIRGVRSLNANQGPLYVVDGMVLQNSDGISNLNPQDIESIDVLKDASATAIYGSRGANGVILVTTKHGKDGRMSLNYSGSVTFEKMYSVEDQMSAAEWLQYARLAKYNMGTYKSTIGSDGYVVPSLTADQSVWGSVTASFANIAQAYDSDGNYDASKVGSYDWTSLGKQTGITQEHTISAAGGTDKFQGYGSFGYLKQRGTQPGQNYTRYTAKVTFDGSPKPYFKMGTSINATYGDQDYGYSFQKSTTGSGDYYSALQAMLPWTVPYDENGAYIRNPAAGDVNIINPISELSYTTNNRKNFNVSGSFYGQLDFGKIWEPLDGLKYRIQFGPEFKFYQTGTFWDGDGINGDGNNTAKWNHYTTRAWTLDNLVYYDKTIAKDHKIGLTLMQSASGYHYDYSTSSSVGVAMDTELWYNMSSGTYTLGTGYSENQMSSYMIRANYGYKDKYMLTASVRWDGSSVLAEGHKWASFPSMALAWRADQESFLRNVSWLSQLKLRLGVGVTGNSAISAFGTKGAIQGLYYNWGTTSSSLGYVGSDASSASPNKMQNNSLGWERTTQYNLGLDYGFLNSRINGSIDIYKTKTKDLLMSMVIPSMTGYTSTYANVGKTKGWGIDFQLNAIPVQTKDLTWTLGLTWSKDKSEIVELSNGNTQDLTNRWFVGEEIGVYYDYVYDGIWKTSESEEAATYNRKPGQIKVKDIDGDGKITTSDKAIVGTVRPTWSGGITSTLNYKNWEFSFFVYSRWGFTVPNGSLTLDGRYMQRKIDYWIANVNENAYYYSPGINGESADAYQSSMNYQDGSFIKLRNVSLGYTFTSKQLKGTGINNLKVYVQAMNPWRIYSKCDYLDTDLLNYSNNTTNYGSETSSRSFVIGLNVGF
jgi:TonB-linked SusC/RagA family outer membrane protein